PRPKIRVDQIERGGVEVEDREHAAEPADLPAPAPELAAEQREGLAEVRAPDMVELRIVEIPLVDHREVRVARIGDQRVEQLDTRPTRERGGGPPRLQR